MENTSRKAETVVQREGASKVKRVGPLISVHDAVKHNPFAGGLGDVEAARHSDNY
jgi:hypothetical protein